MSKKSNLENLLIQAEKEKASQMYLIQSIKDMLKK